MQLANQEAQRLRHEYIRTEHILLGLVKESSGVAANVLKNLDIDLNKVRREVEKLVPYAQTESAILGRLPQTPRTKKVIEYSIEEARNLNHNYVGTEHLLLGLLREQEGVAAQVLMNLGLRLDAVRQEVMNLLGHNKIAGAGTAQPSVVSVKPAAPPPVSLTADQLRAIRERLRQLNEEKEACVARQEFERAAQLRDDAEALARLLAWYEWFRERP
jgi:ATP-dependent Clp protease ATP-binding subunit ClpA